MADRKPCSHCQKVEARHKEPFQSDMLAGFKCKGFTSNDTTVVAHTTECPRTHGGTECDGDCTKYSSYLLDRTTYYETHPLPALYA